MAYSNLLEVIQEHIYGYCRARDAVNLRAICSSLLGVINPLVEASTTIAFRIPHGGKISTLSPQSIIVFSPSSIHKAATHIELRISYNDRHCNALLEALPPNLTSLAFKVLELGRVFKRPGVQVDCLPQTLTQLKIGWGFNQPVDHLPQMLTWLKLGFNFNRAVDNLPPALTYLKIGDSFMHSVNNLPTTLTYLKIGDAFNEPIVNLPPKLTYLELGSSFNQPVNELPSTLTHLKTGKSFNQPIDKLPPTITHFSAGMSFNQSVACLPAGCEVNLTQ